MEIAEDKIAEILSNQKEIFLILQNLEKCIIGNSNCPLYKSLNKSIPKTRINTKDTDIVDICNDPITNSIVQVLTIKDSLNISRMAYEVRKARGTASRRIIRKRLNFLVKQGIVVKVDGHIPMYNLAFNIATFSQSGHLMTNNSK